MIKLIDINTAQRVAEVRQSVEAIRKAVSSGRTSTAEVLLRSTMEGLGNTLAFDTELCGTHTAVVNALVNGVATNYARCKFEDLAGAFTTVMTTILNDIDEALNEREA